MFKRPSHLNTHSHGSRSCRRERTKQSIKESSRTLSIRQNLGWSERVNRLTRWSRKQTPIHHWVPVPISRWTIVRLFGPRQQVGRSTGAPTSREAKPGSSLRRRDAPTPGATPTRRRPAGRCSLAPISESLRRPATRIGMSRHAWLSLARQPVPHN